MGVENWKFRMVCLCVDGAAVNLYRRRGLEVLLLEDLPWPITIHFLNHRLDLAVKNSFAKTYMCYFSLMLMDVYYEEPNEPAGTEIIGRDHEYSLKPTEALFKGYLVEVVMFYNLCYTCIL